jgi:hypothetical protein
MTVKQLYAESTTSVGLSWHPSASAQRATSASLLSMQSVPL